MISTPQSLSAFLFMRGAVPVLLQRHPCRAFLYNNALIFG
jgi:hypothetical protein